MSIGGNIEQKQIGFQIGVNGTHDNTEINAEGHLTLAVLDIDANNNPIYAEEGSWISEVIDLQDKFTDFDKVFATETSVGNSSYAIQTRVSDNGADWSEWTPTAMDGTIQSDTKQYIQVRITLYAGFIEDLFVINKGEYVENNEYVEVFTTKEESFAVPILTSNTSSPNGFAFAETVHSTTYSAWKAFGGNDDYVTLTGVKTGFLGYCFNEKIKINGYKIKSTASNARLTATPKSWMLEASMDTTDGTDGTWVTVDEKSGQTWSAVNTEVIYRINTTKLYKAYRLKWTENNGYTGYTAINELNFLIPSVEVAKLKRNYEHDMSLDTTWTEEGSLHRKKIARDEWLRIDKMNVLRVVK